MRKHATVMIRVAAVLSVMIALPVRGAQEKGGVKPAMAAVPGAAEMERLKFYLGEWDYTETYPNGAKNTGVYISKLGPGGNSLVQNFHSKGPVGDFEGFLIMTWDPKEKAYKEYVFSSDAPGCVIETGQFEGDVLTYRAELSMGDKKVVTRNTTRLVAPGKIVSEQYFSAGGGPEKLVVHVEATKR
jgi:hypothetical protein